MIAEDYVSYEVAKLLKERGFDEYCRSYYELGEPRVYVGSNGVCNNTMFQDESNECIARPTHQMAMKWLRKNKGLFINIGQHKCMNAPIKYHFSVWKDVTYIGKSGDTGDYPTYEEAVETALKYCLTKLI